MFLLIKHTKIKTTYGLYMLHTMHYVVPIYIDELGVIHTHLGTCLCICVL